MPLWRKASVGDELGCTRMRSFQIRSWTYRFDRYCREWDVHATTSIRHTLYWYHIFSYVFEIFVYIKQMALSLTSLDDACRWYGHGTTAVIGALRITGKRSTSIVTGRMFQWSITESSHNSRWSHERRRRQNPVTESLRIKCGHIKKDMLKMLSLALIVATGLPRVRRFWPNIWRCSGWANTERESSEAC
jgi:hypothetical protein